MRNGKDEDIVCSALKNAEGGGQRPLSQHKGTTAGWKGTFPYDKLIQLLIWQIVKPGQSIVLGGTWRKNMGCAKYKKQGERLVSGVLKVA